MPLEFEYFKTDNDDYYAIVSKGSLVYSSVDKSFINEANISLTSAQISLSSGNLNRIYGSIENQYLSDGIYAVRIYRKSNSSPSSSDELMALGRTAWSSALSSQFEPSNADDISSIIAIQNIYSRGYSVRMTGSFLGNSNAEIGLAEMFISPRLNKCTVSMSVSPLVPGVNYTAVSVRTNDSSRSVIQEVSVINSSGSFSFDFIPTERCMTYLMNGNFIFALSSGLSSPPRIAGNPENKSVPSIPGVPNISFERNAPNTGISFRSV